MGRYTQPHTRTHARAHTHSSFELFDDKSATRTGTKSEIPPHTHLKTRLSGALPASMRPSNLPQTALPPKGLVT
jgi:hypothetical protein